jgi:carbonic anhydrase
MNYDRRAFLFQAGSGIALAATTAGTYAAAPSSATPHDAKSAMRELQAGNARFVADRATCPPLTARRLELAEGQHPFAIVLSCSDSRVPVETVFDQIPGNIFGIRIAGNFVDRGGVGSIEYGVAVLKAPLILVLGHSECGAVKASLAFVDDGTKEPGQIQYLIENIAPDFTKGESMNVAVESNVRSAMRKLRSSSKIVADAVDQGHAEIAGGVYDLSTGAVTFLTA